MPRGSSHAFNPSTWEAGRQTYEFEASLVYRVSSRTARATQKNPVLENKQTNKKQNNNKKTQKNQTNQI